MTRDELSVHVNGVEDARPLKREGVVQAVRKAAEAEGVATGEISVTFLGPADMAALNEKYGGRQGPTDVIAFNLDEPMKPLGDVYICPQVAREAVQEYGVEFREELLRLVVHGVLHVFGYDHPEDAGREDGEIFRRQEAILSELI